MRKLFYTVGISLIMLFSSTDSTISTTAFHTDVIEERIAQFKEQEFNMKHESKINILNRFSIQLDNKEEIFDKIDEISEDLSIESDWLLLTICRESRANPKAINPYTKATGIIQWLPSTARDLKTSTHHIYRMSFVDQLDLVKKYVNRVNGDKPINSYGDLYLTVFYPRAVGMPDDYIIGRKNSLIVKYNYPMSNHGIITVKDAKLFAGVGI